jgi:acyl carrier protein
MTTEDLLKIIANALKVDSKKVTLSSKSESFDEWDSLGHLNILVQANSVFDFQAILRSKNIITD